MKGAFFALIAALSLAGCTLELPDFDPAGFVSSSKPATATAAAPTVGDSANHYRADQSPDNTGDYSHYF